MEDWDRKRLEATVQAAALCAYVDDHLAPTEREKLCECVAVHAASEIEARELIGLVRNLPEWAGSTKPGFRARQYGEIKTGLRTAQEREHAFELAVHVAHAHQGIGLRETSFLLDLMEELGVDHGFAVKVINSTKE